MDPTDLETVDSRTLGGIVVNASIIYDTNNDGVFDQCGSGSGSGVEVDEQYAMLLYVGHCDWIDLGEAKAAANGVKPHLAMHGAGTDGAETILSLTNMPPGETVFIILGLSELSAPFKFGTLIPNPDILLPALPTFAGELEFPFGYFALPTGFELFWQAWITGPGIVGQFSSTNGVKSVTP